MDPIEDGLWAGGRVHEKSNQVFPLASCILSAGSQEVSNRRRQEEAHNSGRNPKDGLYACSGFL
jgi:hypothetical protein